MKVKTVKFTTRSTILQKSPSAAFEALKCYVVAHKELLFHSIRACLTLGWVRELITCWGWLKILLLSLYSRIYGFFVSAAWPINWLNFYAKCFLRVRQIEKYLRILLLLFKLSFKGVKIRSSITTKLLFKSISMESIKVSVSDGNSLSTVSCLHRSKSIVAPFFVPLLSTMTFVAIYTFLS